jgi:hypothetical protein
LVELGTEISLPHCGPISFGAHPTFFLLGRGTLFMEEKQLGYEADQTPTSCNKVKKAKGKLFLQFISHFTLKKISTCNI